MAGTQSIRRAVALLEAFGDDRPAWSASDLAETVGLNRTTVYRLLTALESVEYVTRDPATDTYRLGSGLIALGARAQRANPARAVADYRCALTLGGNAPLPQLFATAGARFAFDEATVREAVALIENTLAELESTD